MAEQLGARDRFASVSVALVLIVGLFYSRALISFTPTFFSAGLMLYGSTLLVYQWAVQSRSQMVKTEWAITIVILFSIIMFGILYGIVLGLAISCLTFVYNYSKLPVIRNVMGGHELRSLVDRSQIESHYLVQYGQSIAILRLQGYLFFGTADGIVRTVRDILSKETDIPVRFILLDFSHVSGLDTAAAACFVKIRNLCVAKNTKLFFCNLLAKIESVLRRSGPQFDDQFTVLFPDVDHALEICEDHLLKDNRSKFDNISFENHIASILGQNALIPDLINVMPRFDLDTGETLIRSGDEANDVYIVADGRIKVEIGLHDGTRLRLRSMTKGAIVGEIGQYLKQKRSADIVVEDRATLYRMSTANLEILERENPSLSSMFHRLIAVSLSEKMVIANQLISRSKE
jgi:SulP family sulfate permease